MPELSGRRRLHGGTDSASGGRVKAVSRASGGAKAPALTRTSDADTLKPRKSTLTEKTVAYPGGVTLRKSLSSGLAVPAITPVETRV